MDCVNCEDHFTVVLEDSDSALAQSSREHLQACPACQARYESFRQTVQQLRALPVVTPPPGMLRGIGLAVDAQARSRSGWTGAWQPLTAGLSVAACLMLVMWTTVLNPLGVANTPATSQFAQSNYGLMQPGMPAPPSYSPTPGTPTRAAVPAPARAPRPGPTRMVTRYRPAMRPSQEAFRPFADDFGAWGRQLASAPVTTAPASSSGKPAGTFAASDGPTSVETPLARTGGEVQLAFTPPTDRTVGAIAVGQLLVNSQAEAGVTIRVQPNPGLRVLNARDGVLYQGPLRKGDKLELPVRLIAARPGVHRVRLALEADVAGVSTELPLVIPAFVVGPEVAGQRLVTQVFTETPSVRAIRVMAAAAGARVVIAEGVESHVISYDFSAGVPLAVALRTLCDGCGYSLEERDGVYHVGQ